MRRIIRNVSNESHEEVTYSWPFLTIDEDYKLIEALSYEVGRRPVTLRELVKITGLSYSKIARRIKGLCKHRICVSITNINSRNPYCREILKKYFGEPKKKRGRPEEEIIFLLAFDEKEREEIMECIEWRF